MSAFPGAHSHCGASCRRTPANRRRWLSEQRKSGAQTQATSNGYVAAIRAFANWLEGEGVFDRTPLSRLRTGNAEATRVRRRRALTEPEVYALFEALPGAPDFRGTPWAIRRAIYAVGLLTGLRAGEIRSLRASDVNLAEGFIYIAAAAAKNRRNATLAIHQDLEPILSSVLSLRAPGEPLFPGSWWNHAAAMLVLDLERAGIDPVDDRGRVADFHAATRVTFGTRLAEQEVPLQVAQRLLRHSTPALTSNVYTDVRPDVGAEHVAKLPGVRPMREGGQ